MKMKLLAVLALLLLFIIPGCGDDSNYTVNAVTTPAPVGASTVQGTVYGADGQPVGAGITVRLTPSIASSENYGEQQTTTTNAQGGFSFTVHYAGAYLIDALNGTQLLGSQLFNITGPGQVINILLGQATGQLTVNIVPANAEATVEVWPGGDITTSAATVTGSQTGEYIFYLPAGLYTIDAIAAGYNELEPQTVTIAEGGEETLTFDFETGGEVPVSSWGMDPYACINTGEIPVKYHVEDFTGTGTIDFIFKSTGEVVKTVAVDKSNLNSITFTPDFKATSSYYYFGTYYYLAFTINTIGMPAGYYKVRLTHNPPVIDSSSTTTELEFYIGDTIQGALYAAGETGRDVPYEIITPWGTEYPDYAKVYIPAGNYQQGVSSTFPDGNLEADDVYFQGAGAGNTIIDFRGTGNYIDLDYGVVEGFTIKNSTDHAIYTRYSDNYIYNNRIESNLYGIFSYDSSGTYIFDNIITNNTSHGIYFDDYVYDIYIGNNVISENGGGIYVCKLSETGFITGNNIYKNTCAGAGGGIAIDSYDGYTCEITGNVISENSTSDVGGGIAFRNNSSGNVNIQNNEITKNTAPGAGAVGGGIHFQSSTDFARITGNNIYGNTSNTNTGNQLYVPAPATPLLNADNNWWGTGVTVNDTEVFQVSTPGASVDAGTPATTQFPVPVVPTI